MQELTALQWFNQELQKSSEINNYGVMILTCIDYTKLINKAFELQEQQHKQTYEAGKETYRQHLSFGEGLNHFDFYYDKKFKK